MILFAWHIHDRTLVEPLTAPMETRIQYILENKPAWEIPTRVRVLKVVQGSLPKEVRRVGERFVQAFSEGRGYGIVLNAEMAYHRTLAKHQAEVEALHTQECPDCPWDGETIFPQKKTYDDQI